MARPDAAEPTPPPPTRGRLARLLHKAWWLHSFGALSFGIFVMLFARKGLAYADKLLVVLAASWLLLFIALRTISGPSNPDERLPKKGLRVATNYVIKNLYQQMFFFQVPLYMSSATWSLSSNNFWLPPLLLACAVLLTLDVIFDNFIMRVRVLASLLYGVCLFGVLNLMLPIVFHFAHLRALVIAAATTAPAVALLSFRVRTVFSSRGIGLVMGATFGLCAAAWYGRAWIPPAPLAMSEGAVGSGTPGSHETLPGKKMRIRKSELDHLRCGSLLTEPGGLRDRIVHVWRFRGETFARLEPSRVPTDEAGVLLLSSLTTLPPNPVGDWSCSVETDDGQLVGRMGFAILPDLATAPPPRR